MVLRVQVMKRLCILLLSVISSFLSAQVTITNAFKIPDFGFNKLVTDPEGMIYLLQGKLFVSGWHAVNQKIVIRKYTPDGKFEWERTLTGNDLFLIDACMKSDQLIFAGGFSDTLQYATQQIISHGQHDIYMARISSDGLVSIQREGGSGDEVITGFTVDENQNPYFSGTWSGQVKFAGYNAEVSDMQHFIVSTDLAMRQTFWIRTGVQLVPYPNIFVRELRILNEQLYGRCYNGKILLHSSDTIGYNYSGVDGFVLSAASGQVLKAHTGEWSSYRGGGSYIEDVSSNGNIYWHEAGTMCASDGITCASGSSIIWHFLPDGWASCVFQSNRMHVATGTHNCYSSNDSIIQVGTIGPTTSSVASLTGTFGISGCNWVSLSPYRYGQTLVYGNFSKRLHLPGFELATDSFNIPFVAIINWDRTVGLTENIESDAKIYPNPTRGNVVIESKVSGAVDVYNIRGERIYQTRINYGQNNLDLSHLPAGMYVVQFNDGNSRISKRIVRE